MHALIYYFCYAEVYIITKNCSHADGHHKLIRWRFVTYCGIDGYSRMIVYLKCSTDNRASTAYATLLEGVRQYGLPSRVRTDQGRENICIAQHMLEHCGTNRRSIITGSSVHNQRIERLWRDLHRCVTVLFYRLFYYLEHIGLLDPVNEMHIYALHYVFLPRLRKAQEEFREAWNSHLIRTAQNRSPEQLFTEGALMLQRSGLTALDFFSRVDENYGYEEEGIAVPEDTGVEVPIVQFQLLDEHYAELQEAVNPLQRSDNYGLDLYENTISFITGLAAQHP